MVGKNIEISETRQVHLRKEVFQASMAKIQKSVDEMIGALPRNEQVLVKRLRAIIQECLPLATEKAYYGMGVPFYKRRRMICFIWPTSLVWGPRRDKVSKESKGVSLGFCYGNRMANEDGALLAEGRKQVYVLYIKTLADLDENQIRALLYEAAMVDEMK